MNSVSFGNGMHEHVRRHCKVNALQSAISIIRTCIQLFNADRTQTFGVYYHLTLCGRYRNGGCDNQNVLWYLDPSISSL